MLSRLTSVRRQGGTSTNAPFRDRIFHLSARNGLIGTLAMLEEGSSYGSQVALAFRSMQAISSSVDMISPKIR